MKRRPPSVTGGAGETPTLNVEVVGAGYVGLVTAACLASLGHTVRCVDVNLARIASLESGEVPFSEPGLADLVRVGMEQGRLSFETDVVDAARGVDIVFIAVGTLDGTGRWTDEAVQGVIRSLLGGESVPRISGVVDPGECGRGEEENGEQGKEGFARHKCILEAWFKRKEPVDLKWSDW